MTLERNQHMDALIADIERLCGPLTASIEAAVRAVPRHQFVPDVGRAALDDGDAFVVDRTADADAWWKATYTAHQAIVTQMDDGETDLRQGGRRYSSSISAPATVVDLMELLDPAPGHRILEIGTGTGWTAALLSHLAGEENITSVEVDSALAAVAAKNLAEAGYRPHLVVGDGAEGHPGNAPYDRVHATCSVYRVPYAWVEQCRPGAVIVTPLSTGTGPGHALRLVVTPEGTAQGRFRTGAAYMPMRAQRSPLPPDPDIEPVTSTTRMNPRTIADAPPGAMLTISALTGLRVVDEQEGGLHRVWVASAERADERAQALWESGLNDYPLFQVGDRDVWQEAVDAYFQWVSWGEPRRDRFGLTVTPQEQRIWLDTPDNVIG